MFVDDELVVALPELDVVVAAVVVVVAAVVGVVAVTAPRVVAVSSGLSLEPAQPATRARPPTPSTIEAIIERVLMHRP